MKNLGGKRRPWLHLSASLMKRIAHFTDHHFVWVNSPKSDSINWTKGWSIFLSYKLADSFLTFKCKHSRWVILGWRAVSVKIQNKKWKKWFNCVLKQKKKKKIAAVQCIAGQITASLKYRICAFDVWLSSKFFLVYK